MKRIFLFLATNILVMVTISIIVNLLGLNRYLTPYGINWITLALFCGVWGMAGAFISLAMSRFIAKKAMGVQVLDPNSGHPLVLMVAGMCQKAGIPMPEVGIYESPR
jgi:heat shock protein HtpX